ncbi:hypothetical protein O3P69_001789 [Scylla paramamosain]|uniref:Uncharacterized protein n=1 Tax=Scylla paramamosain TaxID=85552 RepID=A0AAW0V1V5_SCYPA
MLVEGNKSAMANIPKVYDGHVLSQDGLTPLHAAALCGAPSDAVEALLRRGVSPHVTTPDNMTPADLARQQGQDSVIKGLQRHHCVQSYKLPEELHEELLSTVSRRDDVQAVSTLICKGAPIELLGGLSVLRLAVTTDRINTVSLLLASGAPLPASLLQEAWQSPDVTHRVLATLTTAYCCRLRAEQRRLEKVSSALVEGIDNLVTTIEGNTPWQAAWRWGKETDRPALSDLLAKAAAANCPVTAAFLHMAGGWTVFNGASGGTALHAALEAGHKGMAELLIRDLGGCPCVPDTHGRLAVHMMPHEEQQRLEQKLFMAEREKLKDMELRLKADHEKTAARTALCIQEDLFESHKKGEGKNVSLPDGHAALLLASRKGLLQLTHLILQEGHFPVDEVLDHTCGTTALHQAASHGQDGCVALLLSAGANPQQRDTYGHTPRHLAAMFGNKSTFELLAHQESQDPPCRWGITSTQNALLRWLEHRRSREVELGAGQEHDHTKELGAGQVQDHTKELGTGQVQDHTKELGAGQVQDHTKELGAGQERDHTKELEVGQEGDHTKELGAGQEGDHTKELGAGQEGDHTKELGAGKEKDHTKELGAGQEGDHTKELEGERKGDHAKWLEPGREGDPARWLIKEAPPVACHLQPCSTRRRATRRLPHQLLTAAASADEALPHQHGKQ